MTKIASKSTISANETAAKAPGAMPKIKGMVFDLDGTLLDTLPDLTRVTNMALEEQGFPQHTMEEILTFVGNGAERLIRLACPEGSSEEEVMAVLGRFKELYVIYGLELTRHYEGMPETLRELKARGMKLGIVSNKFEAGVEEVEKHFFGDGLFDSAHGESKDIPRKPDPKGLLLTIEEMGCEPHEVAYVGDSHTDMEVAHNAGAIAVACTWGYQPLERLLSADPVLLVGTPRDLLHFNQQ